MAFVVVVVVNDLLTLLFANRDLKERSRWCAAFTKKDLELLEYGGDLLTYYKNAYGNKYSVQMGCPTLKYLLDYTEKRIKGIICKDSLLTSW